MESIPLVNASHFWVPTISSVIIVAILMFIVASNPSLWKSAVFIIGLIMIAIAGCYLYVIDGLTVLKGIFGATEQFDESYDRFAAVFAFIFPFVSAAVGTNLLSDALTSHLKYKS